MEAGSDTDKEPDEYPDDYYGPFKGRQSQERANTLRERIQEFCIRHSSRNKRTILMDLKRELAKLKKDKKAVEQQLAHQTAQMTQWRTGGNSDDQVGSLKRKLENYEGQIRQITERVREASRRHNELPEDLSGPVPMEAEFLPSTGPTLSLLRNLFDRLYAI